MLDKTCFKPRKSHLIREHPLLLKLLEGAPPWYYHIHSQASYVEADFLVALEITEPSFGEWLSSLVNIQSDPRNWEKKKKIFFNRTRDNRKGKLETFLEQD